MANGVKCPHCGTDKHDVIETRNKVNQIQRTRRCFNDHRFTTVEVVRFASIRKPGLRNQIVAGLIAGQSPKEIAETANINVKTVYRVKKELSND